MEQQLTIEMIADAFSYDITGFDCGEEALNTFFKRAPQAAARWTNLKGLCAGLRGYRSQVAGLLHLIGELFRARHVAV